MTFFAHPILVKKLSNFTIDDFKNVIEPQILFQVEPPVPVFPRGSDNREKFQIPEENPDLFQGDIKLTSEQQSQKNSRKLIAYDFYLWSTGLEPTEINYSLDRSKDV